MPDLAHESAMDLLRRAGECSSNAVPQIDPSRLNDEEAHKALIVAQRLHQHLGQSLIPRLAARLVQVRA